MFSAVGRSLPSPNAQGGDWESEESKEAAYQVWADRLHAEQEDEVIDLTDDEVLVPPALVRHVGGAEHPVLIVPPHELRYLGAGGNALARGGKHGEDKPNKGWVITIFLIDHEEHDRSCV